MTEPLELSDAAIETMLDRRARRADPADLAEIALDAIRRAPSPSRRAWGALGASLRLASRSARWVWVVIATMLALALVSGLLGVGASRPLHRSYPLLTGSPRIGWGSGAISGDELWTVDMGLWHYAGGAWQGPLSPPPLLGEPVLYLALDPDGALWVSGETTVAVLRDGVWRAAWKAAANASLSGLVVSSDGTVWVGHGRDLVGLRRDGASYSARSVECPTRIQRIATTTDGTVYVGGFMFAGGHGLARSDGATCSFVDPLGDGLVHEVAVLSAGPAGSLLATVFDEEDGGCGCRMWMALLRDGRWSTISGPTLESSISLEQAISPDGHPWRIDGDLGLERYGTGGWRVVAVSARSLVIAPDGVLWYWTDHGIERIWTDEVGD